MLGAALSRKRPFADIYDDLGAQMGLGLFGQIIATLLSVALTIVFAAYQGYPQSTTFIVFFWVLLMLHYLSLANAMAQRNKLQIGIDAALFIYGICCFFIFVSGYSTAQLALNSIYWILVPARYATFIALDVMAMERMYVNESIMPRKQ